MTQPTAEEREAQKAYWKEHSTEATVEAMMLDSKAADIDKLERPEVMRLLGSVKGLRVVELGAGIGRFTGELAEVAKSVIALDFMQNLIDQNEENNSHYGNITFKCGDATELDLPAQSADVYSSENPASVNLVIKREKKNPTHYRNPREYFAIFDSVQQVLPDGRVAHLELVCCKSVDTYVRVKQNQNQVCWKWHKVVGPTAEANASRHFLDGRQYTEEGIARYQAMFGDGFVSPGGIATTEEFSKLLHLSQDQNVLDVGCGVGGAAVYLARTYGCYVYGIDLSVNMILTALEQAAAHGNGDKISFEVSDATKRDLPDESYDAVFSRDVLIHVTDKPALFERLFKVLKPGGRLVITDYCRQAGDLSEEFESYVAKREYTLNTIDEYQKMLADAGFVDIVAEDRSEQLAQCLKEEVAKVDANKVMLADAVGEQVLDEAKQSWSGKLARVEAGEHRWGLFHASKP
ncbi:hypothetical protein KSW81_007097 [Nannochloris sp. 'desiccata']|nr:hypothetical protein KSW81_007097 [Chlorella desiccata (nom. nud.)]